MRRTIVFLALGLTLFGQFRPKPAGGSGGGLTWAKYTIAYNNATLAAAATTAADVPLGVTLPVGSAMLAVVIKHTTAFTATSLTALTVSLGNSISSTAYSTPFDVFQAASNTTFGQDGGIQISTFAANALTVRFTSTGANLSALTAGSVDIYYVTSPLPSTGTLVP